MYNESLRFNEILDKAFPSNKFDYHLKLLQKENLVVKNDDKYCLTSKGVQVISSMDGVVIEEKRKPITCVFVLGYDEVNDLILVNKRKKQPFMNFVGIPGGKVEYGHSLPRQAREEFFEETGLSAENVELKLVTNYRTVDEDSGELTHHVVGFFFLATGLSGDLVKENREGHNVFIKLSDASSLEKYPDFDFFTEVLLSDNKNIVFQEADRYVKDGKFTKIDFL